MFLKSYILLALCGLAFVYVKAEDKTYECYNCPICSVPFDESKAEKKKQCKYCSKKTTFANKKVTHVVRGCEQSCTEKNLAVLDNGVETKCCQGDLCNSANPTSTGSWATLVGASLIALLAGNRL